MNRVLYQLSYAAIFSLPKISFVIIHRVCDFVKDYLRIFRGNFGKNPLRGDIMRFFKVMTLFLVGGMGYVGLEFLWRGWSHYSMFLAGGTCFLLLGKLNDTRPRLPLLLRGVVGAGIITMIELLAGLLFNRDYSVWDYRYLPGNFHGQICLRFFLIWIPISLGAMWVYRKLQRYLAKPWRFAA